jgi:hypothetical protein
MFRRIANGETTVADAYYVVMYVIAAFVIGVVFGSAVFGA